MKERFEDEKITKNQQWGGGQTSLNLTSRSKRGVAKISIFITSIFVIFISISYAFINQTLLGTKKQVITTGNLELKLTEGNAITLENALPMYDQIGMIQDPFEFQLANKTSNDTNYILKLTDITPDDAQRLDTEYVKYGLEKDGEQTIELLSNLADNVLDSGRIGGNQTINYSLRLWIGSGVEDENVIKDKMLSYRLGIEASQEIEISKRMMKAREYSEQWCYGDPCLRVSSDEYYADEYRNHITNIIIENKVNVPDAIAEDRKWDMSELQNGSVMAYLEEKGTLESGEAAYILHIQGNGKVVANEDCAALFYGFPELLTITGFEYLDLSYVKLFGYSVGTYPISIFEECPKLSLDFSKLDTSNIENMSYMFSGYNSSQPLDLSSLDTSKVTDMSWMFSYYSGGALTIGNWDASNVTDMSYMFYEYSGGDLTIGNWDTSNVIDMSRMFSNCSSTLLLDLTSFDTSNVTDMSGMFSYYSGGALTLGNWDTSNVTDMSHMFSNYSGETLTIGNWDASNVEDMSYMFSNYSSSQPLDLSHLNTSKVTDMSEMFYYYSGGRLTIGDWKTGENADMSYMFMGYSSTYPLDLSSLDTSKVTNMSNMFDNYSSTYPLDLSSLDTSKVTNMSRMFSSYKGGLLTIGDWNALKVTDTSWMFSYYSSASALDLSGFSLSQVVNMSNMFYDYRGGLLTIGDWKTGENADMSNMFHRYNGSESLDLRRMDTSKVVNMYEMFSEYASPSPLDLSSFNTSNVTNMYEMFSKYESSSPLDLSSFNTSNVTNMYSMFYSWGSSASLDISGFDFSKVTNSSYMFSRNSSYYSSPILVKDEAAKAWVLKQNSHLTNVTIK